MYFLDKYVVIKSKGEGMSATRKVSWKKLSCGIGQVPPEEWSYDFFIIITMTIVEV